MRTRMGQVIGLVVGMSLVAACGAESEPPTEQGMDMSTSPQVDMASEPDMTASLDMAPEVDMAREDLSGMPDMATPEEDMPSERDMAPDMPAAPLDLSFCDAQLRTPHGVLCAIQPSKTDAAISDHAGPSAQMPGPGFGYHVIGIPNDYEEMSGAWLHFSGSYGRPYLPRDNAFATVSWADEIMSRGFLVIQIAYANSKSLNGDLCGAMNPGSATDDCAGLARREILTGQDVSTLVEVDQVNSVSGRLVKLDAYLAQHQLALPGVVEAGEVKWQNLVVSGHSQGAGHSYFVAKNMGVRAACFLGGPYDSADTVDPGPVAIADWYTEPGSLTDISHMGAFVVTSDEHYRTFVATYEFLGLVKGEDWFETTGEYVDEAGEPLNGHAASVGAPALAGERAKACFQAALNLP